MKISRATTLLVSAALATVMLAGCGGAAAPADGGSFKTVTDLKDALVKAGGKCDGWDAHNKTLLATTSGRCGDKYALSVYQDAENFATQAKTFRSIGVEAVIGKNWILSGVEAAETHKLLGGELITKK